MELTLAEELLLLALGDESGSTGFTSIHPGLAGALLVDLGRAGAVRVEDGKLVPTGAAAPAHPVLARALDVLVADEKRRTATSWVQRLPRALKPVVGTVAAPLVTAGVLTEDRRKFLGLFPDTRFREADPEPERALRARLRAVLVDGREPAEHDALLVGLLVPLDLVRRAVDSGDRRAAKKRAKQIAEQGVAGDAVHQAVQAEIMAAVLPVIVVTATTSG
ncbi:GOLPH3/VPS74 family protein [Pseudonocardia saturnea]